MKFKYYRWHTYIAVCPVLNLGWFTNGNYIAIIIAVVLCLD